MKQTYMEPWSESDAAEYSDLRVRLMTSGLLAANNHNMQPWKIKPDKADPMVFCLYAGSARLTKEAGPYARRMMIPQRTFLEYVAVAGKKKAGRDAERLGLSPRLSRCRRQHERQQAELLCFRSKTIRRLILRRVCGLTGRYIIFLIALSRSVFY